MVENVENAMTITQLKSQVDGLRDYLWSSGLPNPGDHVEQISYLLFLKMLEERDDEKAELLGKKYKPIFSGKNDKYRWSKLLDKSGRELLVFVRDELFPFMSKVDSNNEDVSEYFHDAVLKITKPDVLHDLIQKIDNEFPLEMLDNDTKGDLYEYLLSKMDAAGELGQFRTPRHLISFITEMVNPQIGETIVDPACGTGGFLIASYFNILPVFLLAIFYCNCILSLYVLCLKPMQEQVHSCESYHPLINIKAIQGTVFKHLSFFLV